VPVDRLVVLCFVGLSITNGIDRIVYIDGLFPLRSDASALLLLFSTILLLFAFGFVLSLFGCFALRLAWFAGPRLIRRSPLLHTWDGWVDE
jgi:hypothetical protein